MKALGTITVSGRSIRRRLVTLALLTAVTAMFAGVVSVGDARATHTYNVIVPPGTCAPWGPPYFIDVYAPTRVSESAGDTQIAFRYQLWRYTTTGWVKDVATPWHFPTVSYGMVYAPYDHDGERFNINVRGAYAVTLEVYSYGLGKYKTFNVPLRVSDAWMNETEVTWCGFGV